MEERRRAILREVEEKGKVRVADLSRRFGCSEVTIRNDIRNMDAEGLLVRTHGGAVKLEKEMERKYSAERASGKTTSGGDQFPFGGK